MIQTNQNVPKNAGAFLHRDRNSIKKEGGVDYSGYLFLEENKKA